MAKRKSGKSGKTKEQDTLPEPAPEAHAGMEALREETERLTGANKKMVAIIAKSKEKIEELNGENDNLLQQLEKAKAEGAGTIKEVIKEVQVPVDRVVEKIVEVIKEVPVPVGVAAQGRMVVRFNDGAWEFRSLQEFVEYMGIHVIPKGGRRIIQAIDHYND